MTSYRLPMTTSLSRSSGKDATHEETPERRALDDRSREDLLRGLLVTFLVLTGVIAVIGWLDHAPGRALTSLAGGSVYAFLLLALPRLGPRRAGVLCVIWYFVIAVAAMASGRGIHDVSITLLPAGLLMAALLLHRRYLGVFLLLSIAGIVGLGASQLVRAGTIGSGQTTTVAEIAISSLLLLVAGALARLVVTNLQARIEERQRAEDRLQRSREELEIRNEALLLVNDLARRLQQNLTIDAIAREAIQVLFHHSQSPLVAIYLLEQDGERLRAVAGHGFTPEEWELGRSLPVEGSLNGLAIREGRIVTTDDLENEDRAFLATRKSLAARGIRSALALPLVFGEEPLGSIALMFPASRAASPLDHETYRAVGQAVSLALSNARHLEGVEHQAFHDALTGLPNRAGLHRDFAGWEARAGGRRIGLVLLDVNRFREINDALGHSAGDQLLIQIASRLASGTGGGRPEVYRLGGDEFAEIFVGIDDPAEVEASAHQLLAVLGQPFEVGGLSLEVAASAGFAVFPETARDSRELLRCADVALYQAKHSPGGVSGYAPAFDRHTPERLALLSDLGRAIREGGLVLHFQPQVALDTGRITGFEALVRWAHPTLGLLSSSEFIPLAEESDVMNPLTYWIVEKALRQLAIWHTRDAGLTMGVNLSVRNLLDRNCPQRLEEIIRRTGVDPSRVEFELTETAVMADPMTALTMLGRITSTGARLAIDDFGTGFFSLAYLRRFPVHAIKIDRSFVSEISTLDKSRAIVRSSIHLAHSLGLRVVAEGIEDAATASALLEMGCDSAQGYYFSLPETAEVIGRRLLRTRHLPIPRSGILERPNKAPTKG